MNVWMSVPFIRTETRQIVRTSKERDHNVAADIHDLICSKTLVQFVLSDPFHWSIWFPPDFRWRWRSLPLRSSRRQSPRAADVLRRRSDIRRFRADRSWRRRCRHSSRVRLRYRLGHPADASHQIDGRLCCLLVEYLSVLLLLSNVV